MKTKSVADEFVQVTLKEIQVRFDRVADAKPSQSSGIGKYLFLIDVTALNEAIYIPVSVATGRQSTGFIYQIEGTAEGVPSASIKCQGGGVTTVMAGSISYTKVPAGKSASFKIIIEIRGQSKKEYKAVISRINYKLNTNDSRYHRFVLEIPTKSLHFK